MDYFSRDSCLSILINLHTYLVIADWATDYFTPRAIAIAVHIFAALSSSSGDFRNLTQTSSYSFSLNGVTGALVSVEQ